MISKKAGLYLHIPFCVKKCNYCDFLSFPTTEQEKQWYAEKLNQEIKERSYLLKDRSVDTVFLGGGTPSLFSGAQIDCIMENINRYYNIEETVEITMEMNPATVTKESLTAYKAAGINRISFGVQSMKNQELALLGRIHRVEDFLKNYQAAREVGFDNINLDLMLALPNQTIKDVVSNLEEAIKLNPEHLSCYGLIIEEGTPFYEKYREQEERRQAGEEWAEDELPTENLERDMYQCTYEVLKGAGYEQYEISNYSKKGYQCRHNLKYWERGEYLGFGLGAASFLGDRRWSNITDRKAYLSLDMKTQQERLIAEEEVIDTTSAMEEFMFLGLRKIMGISMETFAQTFGVEYKEIYGNVHSKMVLQGLLIEEGDRVYLSRQGIDVSNYVMREFMR